ncbi:hypothetical protein EJ03DRAFT_317777 [Teratosphaeria nubilosa]|uniref:FAD-binding FR-type domain-containing protein n=1 Tax=Teratosphaeria nubilosa TaxID=161662 RepID=A0A6G1L0G7_9PEZI|nr:hypothetical protein EJ03DRAFT_317777 [Teratosphaeria nubilosa]
MDKPLHNIWPALISSLQATSTLSTTTTTPPPPPPPLQTCRPWSSDPKDPIEHRKRLINGRAFSQSFLVTYQAAARKRVWLRARSLLLYQPPPIPVLNKTLPQNSTTLLILLLLTLNTFYATYDLTWTLLDVSTIFPDRAGLLFASNLPWLYLFASKNHPVNHLTGYSYENLNILHRRLGEIMCLLALIHAVGMFGLWYCYLLPIGLSLWNFLTHPVVYLGLLAFMCYETLYFTSLASFREWWYEVFLGTHVLLQTGALVFLFLHYHTARPYVAVALLIFLLDRLLFRILLKSKSIRADLTITEDRQTILLSANWPLTQNHWSTPLNNNLSSGWQPTSHIFLTIPSLAPKHIIQAHPFTIASAAPDKNNPHAWFNLLIRAHGGFTRDLLTHAQHHPTTQIRLDGPYGSLHALHTLQTSDTSVVIAGGSGIAVAYPLLWSLLHESRNRDTEETVIMSNRRKVALIWVIQHTSHVSWLGRERLDELEELGLSLHIPSPTKEAGRPDVGKLVREVVGEGHEHERVGVVVSGPDGLNRGVRNTCASMAWEGVDVRVVVEKYGW